LTQKTYLEEKDYEEHQDKGFEHEHHPFEATQTKDPRFQFEPFPNNERLHKEEEDSKSCKSF
jgi:hypothetical protein